jgi:hypothetical protein
MVKKSRERLAIDLNPKHAESEATAVLIRMLVSSVQSRFAGPE